MLGARSGTVLNYGSQIYVALMGILFVPIYLKMLGHEAIGLIGFFTLLQNTLALIDNGLTPTLTRETARYHSRSVNTSVYKGLLRSAEGGLLILLLLGVIILLTATKFISTHWLSSKELPAAELSKIIRIMIISAGFRVLTGLYRGVLVGSNSYLSLALLVAAFGTLKFAFVVPFLNFFGTSVELFFQYQLTISILELFSFIAIVYRFPLQKIYSTNIVMEKEYLKKCFKFALGSASLAIIWVFSSQLDKLIISKVLSLSEFGIYTLSIQACGAISLLAGPILNLAVANFTSLAASSSQSTMIDYYHRVTTYLVIIIAPVSALLVFFPNRILWLWTGDSSVAERATFVLSFYALGSTFLAIRALPWLLLFAIGKLKRHILGNLIFVSMLVPGFYYSSQRYGPIGPSLAWCFANFLYLICWTPLEHRVAAIGFHLKWILVSVFAPLITAFVISFLWFSLRIRGDTRTMEFLLLALFTMLTTIFVIVTNADARLVVVEFIREKINPRLLEASRKKFK